MQALYILPLRDLQIKFNMRTSFAHGGMLGIASMEEIQGFDGRPDILKS